MKAFFISTAFFIPFLNHAMSTINESLPLHSAICVGDIPRLNLLLSDYHDIEDRNESGETPLLIATRYNRLDMIPILLNKGADIEAYNKKGFSCLQRAVAFNLPHMIQTLLGCGADYTACTQDDKARSVFHLAAFDEKIECLKTLLQILMPYGLEVKDAHGHTPLHVAALANQCEAFKVLMAWGSSVYTPLSDRDGATALHIAATHKEGNIFDQIIEHYPYSLEICTRKGDTPLHKAASTNNYRIAKKILDCDGNINAQNEYGYTPLHLLFLKEEHTINLDMLNLFLSHGANIWIQNMYSQCAVDLAYYKGINLYQHPVFFYSESNYTESNTHDN